MRCLRLLVVIGLPFRLFGGCGLFMDFGNPVATADQAARGAFVTVRLFNCLGVSDAGYEIGYPAKNAIVSGTAEGVIDGHRQSVPLKITKLSRSGLSGVWWKRPDAGQWVLTFTVTDAGPYFVGSKRPVALGALVKLRPDRVEHRTILLGTVPSANEIEVAIQEVLADSGT